ncbi:hypothetical protein M413DRAFT_444713 [Hebeloma cylindrosporum]|uniref:Uncharacterized protein n=1 Tax=Hebeloma cylindrosporum TaxID=76867 RepID=A0A0C2XXA6_HEBCY|nr:hypothetical protein M413DRAFT_444713 [Hebeloma cylindrosporum h7]
MESEETIGTSHYHQPSDHTVKAHQSSVSTPPSPQSTLGYSTTSTVLVLSMPSPPSSPAIGSPSSIDDRSLSPSPSESSLPESVSSIFFFSSSGAGSPGHGGFSSLPLSSEEHESGQAPGNNAQRQQHPPPSLVAPSPHDLLLPSITLPHSLHRPTPFGQTLGSLRILVLSSHSSSNVTSILLEDNEDIVDVGEWEAWPGVGNGGDLGRVVKASTDWKRRRAQGRNNALFSGGESENAEQSLFAFEPSRNVEIVELQGYARDGDPTALAARLKSITEAPFRALNNMLHPDTEPSGVVKNLLAGPNSGFWTAMVVLLDDAPTTQDVEIIRSLSTYVPLIVLPSSRVSSSQFKGSPRLSAFTPRTAVALRAGLFRSPERLSMLRQEAVDRFLWWRAVQKWGMGMDDGIAGLGGVSTSRRLVERRGRVSGVEADYDRNADDDDDDDYKGDVSREAGSGGGVWKRRRRRRATTISASRGRVDIPHHHQYHAFDPLHLPSLIVLSFSLFAPLKERVGVALGSAVESLKEGRVQVALIGGFCVGVGVGLWVGAW